MWDQVCALDTDAWELLSTASAGSCNTAGSHSSTAASSAAVHKRTAQHTQGPGKSKRRCLDSTEESLVALGGGANGQQDDAETSALTAELEDQGNNGEALASKGCNGCGRTTGGQCWINVGELVQWALPNGRGLWCRDCFNVWRLRFSDTSKLCVMPAIMKSNPQQRVEFDFGLVAYISLRREGAERVNGPQLASRVALIKWLMGVLGMPPSPAFIVVPLGDAGTSPMSPSHLVTMKVNGTFQLGAILEDKAASRAGVCVSRPAVATLPTMISRSPLFTDREEDATLLQSLCAATTDTLSLMPLQQDEPQELNTDMPRSAKKAVKELASAIISARLRLPCFATTEWQELRESAFTGTLAKLSEAKLEVAHEQLEEHISLAQHWHDNISQLKLFVKKFRDAQRWKRDQSTKLGSLSEPADRVWTFIKQHVKPGITFNLLRLKCKFFKDSSRTLASRVHDMAGSELYDTLIKYDATSQGKADCWLRSLLLDHICPFIQESEVDCADERRLELARDAAEVQVSIMKGCASTQLAFVSMDLGMLKTVCLCGDSQTKFSEVSMAEAHIMETPRLALLKETLVKSKAGIEFLAPLEVMKGISVNDNLGSQRFAHGADLFQDAGILRVELKKTVMEEGSADAKHQYNVIHPDLALSCPMLIERMIIDSLANILEGIKLWSHPELEAHEDDMMLLVWRLGAVVTAAEFSLLIKTRQTLHGALKQALEVEGHGGMAALEACCSTASDALSSGLADLSTSGLIQKVANIKPHIRLETAQCHIDVVVAAAETNRSLREALVTCFSDLSELGACGLPSSAKDAVEQWKHRKSKSALIKGVEFVQGASNMAKMQEFDFSMLDFTSINRRCFQHPVHDASIVLHHAAEDVQEVDMTMRQLLDMQQHISTMPIVTYMQQLIKESTSLLLAAVGTQVHVDAICLSSVKEEVVSIRDYVSSLLSKKLPVSVASLSKGIPSGSMELESMAAFNVFKQIAAASKIDMVEVGEEFLTSSHTLPTNVATAVAELFVLLHQVATGFDWLATMDTSTTGGFTANNRLKTDVELVLNMVKKTTTAAQQALVAGARIWAELDDCPSKLKLSIPAATRWLESAKLKLPGLCDVVLAKLVQDLTELTKLVVGHTPAYEHFLDDSKCTPSLIKKKLIGYVHKNLLLEESIRLFNLMADIGRFRAAFGLEPSSESDDPHFDQINAGSKAFKDAKRAMRIMAACTLVYQAPSMERNSELQKVLKSPGDLPAALLEEASKAVEKARS